MNPIVYFGTGEFAVPALRAVANHVELVVCQPDRPSGRGLTLSPTPVKQAATELGLPVETPDRARSPEFVQQISSLKPRLLVVASYGQILSQALLDSATFGGINLHGSLLPAYRGAAPIQRAILNGDTVTGVTLMQMDRGMDTGDIIAPYPLAIVPNENYGELQERLSHLAADALTAWIERLLRGDYPRIAQTEVGASQAPKIEAAERVIDWQGESGHEFNRWRALSPRPGVVLLTSLGTWRLGIVRPSTESGAPGRVLRTKGSLRIALQSGSLDLIELQPEGKKRMTGADAANGLRLTPGTQLVPHELNLPA